MTAEQQTADEEPSLTSLLAEEYSLKDKEKIDKLDKSKLQKLQILIDQSKAFSQIISNSLVQNTTSDSNEREGEGERNNPDALDGQPPSKRQKVSETITKKSNVAEHTSSERNLTTYKQPKLLQNVTLKPHQLVGMNWLISLYENGLNGILADEMGLGKTVQTIALLCFLLEQGVNGPFLIVSPLSVVSNWTTELQNFAPSLSFVSYIGSKDHRAKLRRKSLKKNHVIVTSYEISLIDFPYLKNTSWSYLVVDEGHRLKNANCMLFTKLKALQVSNRILLTGTPLQNNLAELWSLLNFILPDVFHDFATFQNYFNFSEFEALRDENESAEFNSIISMEIKRALVENLHTILKPFILRRLKADVLQLPPKREYIVYSNLSPLQENLYSALLDNTKDFRKVLFNSLFPLYIKYNHPHLEKHYEELLRIVENDSGNELKDEIIFDSTIIDEFKEKYNFVMLQLKMKRISNPLMQSRQICDSPYHYFFPWDDNTHINQDLIHHTSKLQSLDSIITGLLHENANEKVLIFSQFKQTLELLDIYFSEHPNMNPDTQKYFPIKTATITGTSSKEERDNAIDTFTNDKNCKIFLLSTRAANLGLNLTSATTVILYDSDLNPMVDLQAIARVHRIGQTKPCVVYRLATLATVEEAIWERVITKRVLEGIVIELGEFDGINKGKKIKSKKDSTLDSLLNFYSSKRTSSFRYFGTDNEKAALKTLKSNVLSENELEEIISREPSKYLSDHKIDEFSMPHIKLLSESDVTAHTGFDNMLS